MKSSPFVLSWTLRARRMGFVLALVFTVAPQTAFADWTFCVAEAGRGEAWITGVFAAPKDRQRMEREFKRMLQVQGAAEVDVQCPAAVADKTDAVNAQFGATEFHRKAGDTLHEAASPVAAARR